MLPFIRICAIAILLFFATPGKSIGQPKMDSINLPKLKRDTVLPDSGRLALPAKLPKQVNTYQAVLNRLLAINKFIRPAPNRVFLVSKKKEDNGKEYLFYLLSLVILVFAFFKVFYGRYFKNIFRVFFNTSLRQNQLTDLLLQARLPSLIFNIFFTLTAGLYVWLLIPHYYPGNRAHDTRLLLFCVLAFGIIYIVRFCVLKFIGWITGMRAALNTYIFVIFLINKIIGVILIPLILILAFASPVFFQATVNLTLLAVSIFFIIRFFRSYSLLQQQLSVSKFHFLLYIISLEILPVLCIYKFASTLFLDI